MNFRAVTHQWCVKKFSWALGIDREIAVVDGLAEAGFSGSLPLCVGPLPTPSQADAQHARKAIGPQLKDLQGAQRGKCAKKVPAKKTYDQIDNV
jgi:hypothetical protein